MTPNEVTILGLTWDIRFRDSDYGECFAGTGYRIVSVHKDPKVALALADEFNPILKEAEEEAVVFPIQKFNRTLRNQFGFTLNDVDQCGHNFKLTTETFEVQEDS
jgi:hypothetical protein